MILILSDFIFTTLVLLMLFQSLWTLPSLGPYTYSFPWLPCSSCPQISTWKTLTPVGLYSEVTFSERHLLDPQTLQCTIPNTSHFFFWLYFFIYLAISKMWSVLLMYFVDYVFTPTRIFIPWVHAFFFCSFQCWILYNQNTAEILKVNSRIISK